MYEWLDEQIREIRNRKFHLIKMPPIVAREADEIEWPAPPPPSFQLFIAKYGQAFLFRETGADSYAIRVFPKPEPMENKKGEHFLEFGGGDSGVACFKEEDLSTEGEAPVFETRGYSGLFKTADSFDQWLSQRAKAARKQYTKKEWADILAGPVPFSPEEEQIVQARKEYKWRVVGTSEEGKVLFEVTNNSTLVLPYLSIGIKGPNLVGGVSLHVGSIAPGETKVLAVDVYTGLIDPKEVIAFPKPNPWPEDRELYCEFKRQEVT